MQSKASSPDEYIAELPEERVSAMKKLRKTINDNLPEGFEETMSYGMIGYVVPHSIYPDGYHCSPELPLPFFGYSEVNQFRSFSSEYPKYVKTKLDMGKSCIRFKKPDQIPYELIAELVQKMSVQDWIDKYESAVKR